MHRALEPGGPGRPVRGDAFATRIAREIDTATRITRNPNLDPQRPTPCPSFIAVC